MAASCYPATEVPLIGTRGVYWVDLISAAEKREAKEEAERKAMELFESLEVLRDRVAYLKERVAAKQRLGREFESDDLERDALETVIAAVSDRAST